MNPLLFWFGSLAGLAAAFVLLPEVRLITAILAVPYVAVFIWGIVDLRSSFFVRAYIRNKWEPSNLGLTFDDGPDEHLTADILDLCKRFGFSATFFVVGKNAQAHPQLVKRMIAEGHVVACHDLRHSLSSNFRFANAMIRDIGEAQAIVAGIIGARPLLYRPPVGLANPHLGTALAALKMKCIGWNRSARDAGNRRINGIRRISGLRVRGGDVVLLHDCLPFPDYKTEILAQLESLFSKIRDAKLVPVGINDLFEITAYKVDDAR
jgi:peptidoglycan/xylan/chitin deacetylase (PgdA/CDA1 family)